LGPNELIGVVGNSYQKVHSVKPPLQSSKHFSVSKKGVVGNTTHYNNQHTHGIIAGSRSEGVMITAILKQQHLDSQIITSLWITI